MSNYSPTWVTYDEAVEAKARLRADCVGFVITDGYFFFDIYHREADALLCRVMLSRFDSYAEISPSGNGLHIYGMCDLSKMPLTDNGKIEKEFYQKNSKLGLELYIGGATNRFAIFTGNAISDTPLSSTIFSDRRHCIAISGNARITGHQRYNWRYRIAADSSILLSAMNMIGHT